jgi:hypothetical protein
MTATLNTPAKLNSLTLQFFGYWSYRHGNASPVRDATVATVSDWSKKHAASLSQEECQYILSHFNEHKSIH